MDVDVVDGSSTWKNHRSIGMMLLLGSKSVAKSEEKDRPGYNYWQVD
jgi:hypothetical protein